MCGICGFINHSRDQNADELRAQVRRMATRLQHRGPDDSGEWVEAEAGLAFGHRRLSIIDLSPLGHQPMLSAHERYVLIFNGEIYNFKTLRAELEQLGHRFRGHSDTEVMLAAFEQWGPHAATQRFNGMFAYALWDRRERRLFLARDRMGEKPLYYGWQGNTFFFASELKALRAHAAFQNQINREALALLMRYAYVPAPHSIYNEIFKLLPGTLLTLDFSQALHALPEPQPYWQLRDAAQSGLAHARSHDERELIAELDALLREAVKLRMESDVPLGAFLSGGIDSSLIVALMQAQHTQPVKTFTIGFDDRDYDEAPFAKQVAQHLGTTHTELYVSPEETRAVIPRLPLLYDEPFADSSQIPTFLVSQMARRHVTVCLSGDGGDELFCGYRRYFRGHQLWKKMAWLPQSSRNVLARAITAMPPRMLNHSLRGLRGATAKFSRPGAVGDKLHKFAGMMNAEHAEDFYERLITFWHDSESLVRNAAHTPRLYADFKSDFNLQNFSERMMYLDARHYLPDDILVKVDRASMAVSLEARVPLLDHRIVEFAWQTPLALKLRNDQGKWLVRQVLHRYVPEEFFKREKKGFGVPLAEWLRGPLREWAEALLHEERLQREGFFNPQPIRKKWLEHLCGDYEWQYELWNVLMFQAWLEERGRR